MPSWTVTTVESTAALREGTADTPRQAWIAAIDAARDQLARATPDGCAIVIGDVPALLIPGRTVDGQLDLPAVRAAAERMANAAIGGLG